MSLRSNSFRYPVLGHIANELESLLESGYLIEAIKTKETFSFKANDPVAAEFISEGELINSIDRRLGKKKYDILDRTKDYDTIEEAKARLACLKLNYEDNDFTAVPLVRQLRLPKGSKATQADVIKLVLREIPIPDEQTSWEKIFQFKSDPNNKGRLAVLKDWMNKAISSNRPATEISDELEALLFQYRRSLEIHKIKFRTGTLQTLVVGTAELLENAARLKFSAIAKSIFSAQTARAELYNAELTSPGSALAYLYKVGEEFNK